MIGDVIRQSLGERDSFIPVEALLGNCDGSRMPHFVADRLALANPYYDLERFGVHFVASPRHADMLLVTGPVTRNMADAVKATYEAVPAPKLVVAVGACGCSGGIFAGSGTQLAAAWMPSFQSTDISLAARRLPATGW